jgi:hypothetical protein
VAQFQFTLPAGQSLGSVKVYRLSSAGGAQVQAVSGSATPSALSFADVLPAMSATLYEMRPAEPPPTILANISTRLRVETGDDALIGGFIVSGSQPKKLILRAIGPSLPFADRLANPTLQLFDRSGGLLDTNDDWTTSANRQAIVDSTIAPSDERESATVRVVPPGAYTAVVRGSNDGRGVALVEVYDLDRSADSKLANTSTRGSVQTGDHVMIGGTIVLGSAPQKVIVRALGPSLDLAGKMGNPVLELRDGNGELIAENDDWQTSPNRQAIIDSSIPPASDLESAIVETLRPAP